MGEDGEEGGWEVAVRAGLMVATTGKHLFYCDAAAGAAAAKAKPLEGKPIRGVDIAMINGTRWCFMAGDDKVLEARNEVMDIVFKTEPFAKKLGKVRVAPGGKSVVVGDKTGEVFEIPFDAKTGLGTPQTILAHMSSVITGLEFCYEGKLLATTDKDEHLRVSRYPRTDIVERFCFGHTAFVSGLVKAAEDVLATSGGDSQLRIWQLPEGKCVHSDTHPAPVSCLAAFAHEGTPHVLASVEGVGLFAYSTKTFEKSACLHPRAPIAMEVGPDNMLYAAFIGETAPFLVKFKVTPTACTAQPFDIPVDIASVKPSFWQMDLEKKRKLKAGEGTPADHARKRAKLAEGDAVDTA